MVAAQAGVTPRLELSMQALKFIVFPVLGIALWLMLAASTLVSLESLARGNARLAASVATNI
jgi:hypothetical protein